MNAFGFLFLAIICEVFASLMLKSTNGFKKFLPSIGVLFGYGFAFYSISLSLKTIPLGMAYAIWSGVGTALTAIAGITIYKEKFNRIKFLGVILIISGVIILNIANGEL